MAAAMNLVTDSMVDVWLGFRTGNDINEDSCLYTTDVGSKTITKHLSRQELPIQKKGFMRFIIISDTHTRHRNLGILPKGDVFIHSGDILMSSRLWSSQARINKYRDFNRWLGSNAINCKSKIIIGGNHDAELAEIGYEKCCELFSSATYLENTSTIIQSHDIDSDLITHATREGNRNDVVTNNSIKNQASDTLSDTDSNHSDNSDPLDQRSVHFEQYGCSLKNVLIYGTPCSQGRSGNRAFQNKECYDQAVNNAVNCNLLNKNKQQDKKPVVSVLVSHGQNRSLRDKMSESHHLKAHLWGHAHGHHGVSDKRDKRGGSIASICSSIMDTHYCPTNPPIVLDLYVGTAE